jgi:hypothetical protein
MGTSPGRGGHPISLYPLTPEEALRRVMAAPVPKSDPKPRAKPKAKKAAKKAN